MTKKEYMKPEIELNELDMTGLLLANSVQSSGLGDNEEISQDDTPGDSWNDAMSREGVWEEE